MIRIVLLFGIGACLVVEGCGSSSLQSVKKTPATQPVTMPATAPVVQELLTPVHEAVAMPWRQAGPVEMVDSGREAPLTEEEKAMLSDAVQLTSGFAGGGGVFFA